jgi:hypothetical protein
MSQCTLSTTTTKTIIMMMIRRFHKTKNKIKCNEAQKSVYVVTHIIRKAAEVG